MLITHDLAVVAGMAQRVALMYAGQIIEVASADEFFSAPKHPYAQALLRALPDAGRRGEPLAAIAGTVPALTQTFTGCRFAPRCASAMAHCASTLPELTLLGPTHSVRCLLHADGARATAAAGAVAAAPPRLARPARQRARRRCWRCMNCVCASRSARGLLQRTAGHFEAVGGVSFEILPGQTLALVGESGCGKTTIGKAIVQLLRGQADIDGRALLGGSNLFELQGGALQAPAATSRSSSRTRSRR